MKEINYNNHYRNNNPGQYIDGGFFYQVLNQAYTPIRSTVMCRDYFTRNLKTALIEKTEITLEELNNKCPRFKIAIGTRYNKQQLKRAISRGGQVKHFSLKDARNLQKLLVLLDKALGIKKDFTKIYKTENEEVYVIDAPNIYLKHQLLASMWSIVVRTGNTYAGEDTFKEWLLKQKDISMLQREQNDLTILNKGVSNIQNILEVDWINYDKVKWFDTYLGITNLSLKGNL